MERLLCRHDGDHADPDDDGGQGRLDERKAAALRAR